MQISKLICACAGKSGSFFSALIGASGFTLSFLFACLVLARQGNPGVLVIWLLAVGAMTAFLRANHQWLKTFERICAAPTTAHGAPLRNKRNMDVQDVAFRELPARPILGR